MGKSPAKWIKTVLFGKKSSKSNQSKAAKVEKKAATEGPVEDFDVSPPVISDASYQSTDRVAGTGEAENGLPCEAEPAQLGVDLLDAIGLNPTDDAKREKLEQAATKAQASFRGYLARRAFRALKGIIRLQALIRGHLVRRQAVATLRCMQSVVKLQALVRGQRARLSNPNLQLPINHKLREILDSTHVNLLQVNTGSRSEKLAANAFTNKLLVSLPTALPLSLQYDMDEPNAAWNWLERWSLLRFWEPLVPSRKISDAKSQVKHTNRRTVEAEPVKSRRTFRKGSTVTSGDNNTPSSLEAEKPRRNSRKPVNHQTEAQTEQAQNELERVKRSLRKVSASTTSVAEKSEVEVEKPQQNARKAPATIVTDKSEVEVEKLPLNARKAPTAIVTEESEVEVEKPQQNARKAPAAPTSDASESVTAKPSEKQSDLAVDKADETEASSEPLIMEEPVHVSSPDVEPHSLENDEKVEIKASVAEELGMKEDQTGKENQKTRRRKTLPTKQEYPENVSQNTASLPSYMAATESAKAKLKAQGSAKLSEDGVENGNVRRQSLPSSTNGKLSSFSPRLQNPAQANGKGGSKSNKTLSASKDASERVLQPGWRR